MTVFVCVCAVGYQIVDRVMFYYTWPINVNVQINYVKSLDFPAVTICNQNAFRLVIMHQVSKFTTRSLVQ